MPRATFRVENRTKYDQDDRKNNSEDIMPNGNGSVTYRAVVGTLSGILILIGGFLYTQMDKRIEKIEGTVYRIEMSLAGANPRKPLAPMAQTLADIKTLLESQAGGQ